MKPEAWCLAHSPLWRPLGGVNASWHHIPLLRQGVALERERKWKHRSGESRPHFWLGGLLGLFRGPKTTKLAPKADGRTVLASGEHWNGHLKHPESQWGTLYVHGCRGQCGVPLLAPRLAAGRGSAPNSLRAPVWPWTRARDGAGSSGNRQQQKPPPQAGTRKSEEGFFSFRCRSGNGRQILPYF